jgi:peptidyl-prolyl cis-trans isomerase B (cyclophilin B)
MKRILILVMSIFFLFSQQDSLKINPGFDLSKGLQLKGLIPNYEQNKSNQPLIQHQIDEIMQKAKDFIPEPVSEDDVVIMETSKGTIKLKLFPKVAPNHCLNFKKLANSGYYDGTTFHRIIQGFMIQGGDILSRDGERNNDGTGGPGWTVDAEFNDIPHKRGVLSMARAQDPNSAGSQFFICVADANHLDGKYTVFGEVIDRIHVIDHIVNTPTDYEHAKMVCKNTIPNGEDPNDWVKLSDSKTRRYIYSKIPTGQTKEEYARTMQSKLRSDKPAIPIKINRVRVVNNNAKPQK